MSWSADDVADELATLWQLDTDHIRDDWVIHTRGYSEGEFALQLDGATYVVTVEQVRGQQ